MKFIFLRDAGILNKNNKTPFFTRMNNCINLCKKYNLNIQITIHKNFFLKNINTYIKFQKKLSKIDNLTIHLHADYNDLIGQDNVSKIFFKKLALYIKKLKNVTGICIHPDHIKDYSLYKKMKRKNLYVSIEVTDLKSKSGNRFIQIKELLKKHKELDLVLDSSHINSIRSKYRSEKNFNEYVNYFKDRIVEFQLSNNINGYETKHFQNNFNTDHSLLCLKKNKLIKELMSMKYYFKRLNIVMEGVVPYNFEKNNLLKKEIKVINKIINANNDLK